MDSHHLPIFPVETRRSIVQPLFAVKGNIEAIIGLKKPLPKREGVWSVYLMNFLQLAYIRSSRALGAGHHFEAYPISLGERFEPFRQNCGMVHENIRAAILLDKTETL